MKPETGETKSALCETLHWLKKGLIGVLNQPKAVLSTIHSACLMTFMTCSPSILLPWVEGLTRQTTHQLICAMYLLCGAMGESYLHKTASRVNVGPLKWLHPFRADEAQYSTLEHLRLCSELPSVDTAVVTMG